jgi:hypothetical protein
MPATSNGDGGSSTSDSSIGSSSGYGSQSTVRVEEQHQHVNNQSLTEGKQLIIIKDSSLFALFTCFLFAPFCSCTVQLYYT